MKHYLPQIMWHSQNGILAAHFQNQSQCLYKVITGGLETDASSKCVLRIWELRFVGQNEEMHIDFIANLQRHDQTVNVVRFSPNGKYIASGDMSANLFIWEQQEHIVAPDIFGDDDEDMPPNKETWKVVAQLRGQIADITDLAWSHNNELLCAVSVDKSAVVYNVKDMKKDSKVAIIKDFRIFPNGVCFDPSTRYMCIMACDRELRIFSVDNEKHKIKIMKRLNKCKLPLPLGSRELGNDEENWPESRLFHDDQLGSYTRRCAFSPCSELLVTPAGQLESGKSITYATYVFTTASNFDRPAMIYTSSTPTFGVAFSPLLYALRFTDNMSNPLGLPYRCLFAVIGAGHLEIFDTQSTAAIAHVSSTHYAAFTDVQWSPDGRLVMATSQDGYCSFLRFADNELGTVIITKPTPCFGFAPALLPLQTAQNKKRKRAKPKIQNADAKENQAEAPAPISQSSQTPQASKKRAHHQTSRPKTPASATPKAHLKPLTAFFPPAKIQTDNQDVQVVDVRKGTKALDRSPSVDDVVANVVSRLTDNVEKKLTPPVQAKRRINLLSVPK